MTQKTVKMKAADEAAAKLQQGWMEANDLFANRQAAERRKVYDVEALEQARLASDRKVHIQNQVQHRHMKPTEKGSHFFATPADVKPGTGVAAKPAGVAAGKASTEAKHVAEAATVTAAIAAGRSAFNEEHPRSLTFTRNPAPTTHVVDAAKKQEAIRQRNLVRDQEIAKFAPTPRLGM